MYNQRRNCKTQNGSFCIKDIKKSEKQKTENLDLIVTILYQLGKIMYRVRTAQGKPGKRDFFEKIQGKPGKLREFSDHFYNLRENSGNFILPNISDQIGGALRINEASKRINGTHSPTIISLFVKLLYLAP